MAGREDRLLASLQTFDPKVAEAMEGEMGAQGLLLAIEGIGIGGLGKAQVSGVEVPVLVQTLGVMQSHNLAGLALNLYFYPTGEVLTEVIDQLPLGGDKGSLRVHAHQAAHRLVLLPDQRVKTVLIAHRHAKRLLFGSGVLGLSVVDFGKLDRPGGDLPGLIGTDHFSAAIGIVNAEHRQQRHPVAVVVGLGIEAQLAAVPAASQRETQFIDAAGQFDRIRLVLETLVVVGPPGAKEGIVQLLAIHFRLVETQGRGVEAGASYLLLHAKDLGEDGAGCLLCGQRMGDPFGITLKVAAIQKSGLKAALSSGCLGAVGYFNRPDVLCAGFERCPGITHEAALLAGNGAAVPDGSVFVGHRDAIRFLQNALPLAFQLPAESRAFFVQAERRGLLFNSQIIE